MPVVYTFLDNVLLSRIEAALGLKEGIVQKALTNEELIEKNDSTLRGILGRFYQLHFLCNETNAFTNDEEVYAFLFCWPEYLHRRFDVIAECRDFIVFDKPFDTRVDVPINSSGDPVRSWPNEWTCADEFKRLCPSAEKVFLCHQLDHATSGVLLFAKTAAAAAYFSHCFAARLVKKEYLAVVIGHVNKDHFTNPIVFKIAPTTGFAMSIVPNEWREGLICQTDVEIVGVGDVDGVKVTLLKLLPLTGRRHQLRVLCAQILRAPILGDETYKRPDDPSYYRTCLHAHRLAFPKCVHYQKKKMRRHNYALDIQDLQVSNAETNFAADSTLLHFRCTPVRAWPDIKIIP